MTISNHQKSNPNPAHLAARIDALLDRAEAGGPGALAAARRAATLADGRDLARARRAWRAAARLAAEDSDARLFASRAAAEAGDLAAAAAEAEAALNNSADARAQARAAFLLGEFARSRGEIDTARAHYQNVLNIEDRLLGAQPDDPEAARWYARALGRIAEMDAAGGLWSSAQTGADAAAMLARAVARQLGETPEIAADIADAELRRAAFAFETGDAASARLYAGEARARYEALAVSEPEAAHWRAMLAESWALRAEIAFASSEPDACRDAIDRAFALRTALASKDQVEQWPLIGVLRLRAGLLAMLNEKDESRASLAQAHTLCARLHAEAPSDPARTRYFMHLLLEQASISAQLGDAAAADSAAGEAARWATQLGAPDIHLAALDLRAAAAIKRGDWPAARAYADAALGIARAHADTDDPAALENLASALARSGEAALGAEAFAEARLVLRENLDVRLRLAEAAPGDRGSARRLALGLEQLGRLALARGDAEAARAAWEEELILAEHAYDGAEDGEGARFCAIIEALLASLGGPQAVNYRDSALKRLDRLAAHGGLTDRDAALRKQLWDG